MLKKDNFLFFLCIFMFFKDAISVTLGGLNTKKGTAPDVWSSTKQQFTPDQTSIFYNKYINII